VPGGLLVSQDQDLPGIEDRDDAWRGRAFGAIRNQYEPSQAS
jgi:hypothetical protein